MKNFASVDWEKVKDFASVDWAEVKDFASVGWENVVDLSLILERVMMWREKSDAECSHIVWSHALLFVLKNVISS